MIDIWLLATLFVPFMEVLAQIFMQRLRRNREGLKKRLREEEDQKEDDMLEEEARPLKSGECDDNTTIKR